MRRLFVRTLPLLALLLAPACDETATPVTPTPPAIAVTTETFEGTLNKNGAVTFTFTTGSSGTVTAQLLAVAPDDTVALGFSLGTWNGTGCSTSGIFNDNALQGSVILGSVSASATLCARAYDVGKIATNTTFTIEVVHP